VISDDLSPLAEDFTIPFDGYQYVGGYLRGEIIALMVYHCYKDGSICHVQVLPEHRQKHAQKFGEQSLLFRGTQPLYAEIPSNYQNVLDFAYSFGFKVIDMVDDGCIKNGIKYNVNILRMV